MIGSKVAKRHISEDLWLSRLVEHIFREERRW
jgi:hypothetical protein